MWLEASTKRNRNANIQFVSVHLVQLREKLQTARQCDCIYSKRNGKKNITRCALEKQSLLEVCTSLFFQFECCAKWKMYAENMARYLTNGNASKEVNVLSSKCMKRTFFRFVEIKDRRQRIRSTAYHFICCSSIFIIHCTSGNHLIQ